MSFIVKTSTTKVLDIRITDKGRELLTKGLRDQDTFDIVKFSFGDSEIDYLASTGTMDPLYSIVSTANWAESDIPSKIYYIGSVPSGSARVSLSNSILSIPKNSSQNVSVYTKWYPVIETYIENYKWTNLGPMKDWQFVLLEASNTRSAEIQSLDITGSTKIKVQGQLSGKYTTLTINIID